MICTNSKRLPSYEASCDKMSQRIRIVFGIAWKLKSHDLPWGYSLVATTLVPKKLLLCQEFTKLHIKPNESPVASAKAQMKLESKRPWYGLKVRKCTFVIFIFNHEMELMEDRASVTHCCLQYYQYLIPDKCKHLSEQIQSVKLKCPSLHISEVSRNTVR